ncbi:hypothetical protein GJAV_G00050440 [Gymnothorax javanicus]|nr:hypothetical protein GJAV_G00050440 [Gymnothorax javanicus]
MTQTSCKAARDEVYRLQHLSIVCVENWKLSRSIWVSHHENKVVSFSQHRVKYEGGPNGQNFPVFKVSPIPQCTVLGTRLHLQNKRCIWERDHFCSLKIQIVQIYFTLSHLVLTK